MSGKICNVSILPDGTVESIYHDEIFGNMDGLDVERVTDVEFDKESQEWVAKLVATGEEIARGKLRENVLADEVRIVSEMIFNGKQLRKQNA